MEETPRFTFKAVNRFTREQVEAHLARNHPNCPPEILKKVVKSVAKAPWVDANLAAAVGLTMQAIVRHSLTRYDDALDGASRADYARIKKEFTREAGRIIASWGRKPEAAPGAAESAPGDGGDATG